MESQVQEQWPFFEIQGYEISSLFMDVDEYSSSDISCVSSSFPSDYSVQFTCFENELLPLSEMEEFSLENLMENFGPDLTDPFDNNMYESEEASSFSQQETWSPTPSIKSTEATIEMMQFTLLGGDTKTDNNLGLLHLLKAYGAAVENDQRDLAGVIMARVNGKVSPVGEPLERVAFNLSEDGGYTKKEYCTHFEEAFRGIYELFPSGRFAHFASNSIIIDAIPSDAQLIHIVDFDIGEAIQWPAMIETLAKIQRPMVKLTAIKWGEDYNASPHWNFAETKRRLSDHAKAFGVKLEIKEMTIDEFASEMKRMKKRGGDQKEWLAFNCMVSLPHMGRERSSNLIQEFLHMAKDLLMNFQGIVTFGDGDACETTVNGTFSSFFEGRLAHYQALLESMESNFPARLAEARMALESMFVRQYISTHVWYQKWANMTEGIAFLGTTAGLEGQRVSRDTLTEAKELVRDGVSLYGVRSEGSSENKIVLEWNGTPLVMISTWRSQS
ncbi:hypothetical protein ACFE04_001656 [Oxalis oulophora]